MSVTVYTVLWVSPDGEPFRYRTRPATTAPKDEARSYKPRDVQRYERMIRKLRPDCTFRCLSNVEIPGIETVPLKYPELIAWWAKMELFRPDLPKGRNVYFDLDTVPVKAIDEIVDFPAPFAAAEPGFMGVNERTEPWTDQEGKLRIPGVYQTSVMAWESDYGHRFWEAFRPEFMEHLASDQDFLSQEFPNEARMPAAWFAKIRRCRRFIPPSVKVVFTQPLRNDRAAELFPWVAQRWL